MFGQTIKSSGDGRGRKKGYEKPGHKWIKRISRPGGGYQYIYDRAKDMPYKIANSKPMDKFHEFLVNDGNKSVKAYVNLPGGKRIDVTDRYIKDRQLARKVRRRLDFNVNGRLDSGDIKAGAQMAGRAIKRGVRSVGKGIENAYKNVKKTGKKYAGRFESATNNKFDLGDVTRAGRKAYKNAKKQIKRDKQIWEESKKNNSRHIKKQIKRDKQIWEESKKNNSRHIKKLKKNVKKKLNKIFG